MGLISADTVLFDDCNIAGFNLNIHAATQSQCSYLANLFFNNLLGDGAGGPTNSNTGWYFDGTNQLLARIFISNSWAGAMGSTGMYFKNTKTVSIDNSIVIANGGTGVIIDTGCRDLRMRGCVMTGNSLIAKGQYHGVGVLAGANRVNFEGNRFGPTYNGISSGTVNDTQGYGIIINDSSVTNYTILNNDCTGHLLAGIQDVGGGTSGVTKLVANNFQGAFTP